MSSPAAPEPPHEPHQPHEPVRGTSGGATSTGLDPKVAGLLAYLLGWISGLVLYLMEKQDREVRFHAAQSILVSLALIALYIALMILGFIPVIGLLAFLASIALGIAGFGLWIYLLIQGFNLNHVSLPVLGRMAEDWGAR